MTLDGSSDAGATGGGAGIGVSLGGDSSPNRWPANDVAVSPVADALGNVAEATIRLLHAAGVREVFGMPGGPLMPFYRALHQTNLIRDVLVAHEINAPAMAAGVWYATGRPAAVCATAGPGAANLGPGLAGAKVDGVPIFALTAQATDAAFGRHGSQDSSPMGIDTVRALDSYTCRSLLLPSADAFSSVVGDLLRYMLDRRQPVHLSAAPEVWNAPAPGPPRKLALVDDRRAADPAAIREAARLLLSTRRRAILIGRGALEAGAVEAIVRLARMLRIPVASTPGAAWSLPPDDPLSLGVFGFAGSPLASEVVLSDDVELLLVVGSRLGELATESWDPRLERKRIIQVDREPTHIGLWLPVELPMVGDARSTIDALADELARFGPPAAAVGQFAVAARAPRFAGEAIRADGSAAGLHPALVVETLRRMLPPETLLFSDIGNCMAWLIHYMPATGPGRLVTNLGFAAMGQSLPAAIGAKLAAPARPVVAVLGDAAWRMSGAELFTAVDHDIAPLIICLNSGGHAMVEIGARAHFGGRVRPLRFRRPLAVAEEARALGAEAIRIESPVELDAAIAAGLAARTATVVEVMVDPAVVPPIGARLRTMAASLGYAAEGTR